MRVPATALPGTKPSLCEGDVPQMAPNSSCETAGRRDRPLWSADDLHNPGLVSFSSIDSYITGVWCHSLASSFTQREFGANHGRRFLRNSDLVPSGLPMLGLPTGSFAIGPGPRRRSGPSPKRGRARGRPEGPPIAFAFCACRCHLLKPLALPQRVVAGNHVAAAEVAQLGALLLADLGAVGAPGVDAAAAR